MIALAEISSAAWIIFIVAILFFLALDLGVFHRHAHVVRFSEALLWTGIWFVCAMVFAFLAAPGLVATWSRNDTIEFITGYLIELSLSMDNVFVMALLFAYFRIPSEYQHRVLFWGILGALIMRGFMIGIGVALITLLNWILYVFGALLVFSGVKMMLVETEVEPEKNWVIRLVRKFYPVAPQLDGHKFITQSAGKRALTPLALVLLMVETTDLIFAVDSIPAVFAVTKVPFIVFTSNVFAILGLRSLYFVLAGLINYFRYLKVGLSAVLIFIGIKMLIDPGDSPPRWWFQMDVPTSTSLIVVASIILLSMIASVISAQREKKRKNTPTEEKKE